MKKQIKSIIIVSLAVFLVLSSIWFYNNVYFPSNLSYLSACEPEQFNETYGEIYKTVGQVSVKQQIIPETNQTEKNITFEVFLPEENVIKHEIVHLNQVDSNRLYSCDAKYLRILNEMEAYTFENLPNQIFYYFYDDFGVLEELNINNN